MGALKRSFMKCLVYRRNKKIVPAVDCKIEMMIRIYFGVSITWLSGERLTLNLSKETVHKKSSEGKKQKEIW